MVRIMGVSSMNLCPSLHPATLTIPARSGPPQIWHHSRLLLLRRTRPDLAFYSIPHRTILRLFRVFFPESLRVDPALSIRQPALLGAARVWLPAGVRVVGRRDIGARVHQQCVGARCPCRRAWARGQQRELGAGSEGGEPCECGRGKCGERRGWEEVREWWERFCS